MPKELGALVDPQCLKIVNKLSDAISKDIKDDVFMRNLPDMYYHVVVRESTDGISFRVNGVASFDLTENELEKYAEIITNTIEKYNCSDVDGHRFYNSGFNFRKGI